MGRKKATMELIPKHSIRKATFKNRRASLVKKADELSRLCGMPVYLAVSDTPDDPSPEIWPPTEAAAQALFHATTSQEKDLEDLSRQVTVMQAQLKDLDTENFNLEAEERMMTALPVGSYRLVEVESSDLATRIEEMLKRRMKEVQDRMDCLLSAPKPLSVAPDVGFSTISAHAGMVQPAMISSENGSYTTPILEEGMQIDYGDISISFDPSSGAFMPEQNMQEEMPGLFEVAASSSGWCSMSWDASADLVPIPGGLVEQPMDEEIAAILSSFSPPSKDPDYY